MTQTGRILICGYLRNLRIGSEQRSVRVSRGEVEITLDAEIDELVLMAREGVEGAQS
jgi:hypothetical protein